MPSSFSAGSRSEDDRGLTNLLVSALAIALPVTAALGPYLFPINLGAALYGYRLLVICALPVALLMTRRRLNMSGPVRAFFLTFYVWLVWGIASILWTPDTSAGVNEIVTLVFGITSAIVTVLLCGQSRGAIAALRRGWIAAYVTTGLVAAWELVSQQHLPSSFVEGAGESASAVVISTFGNPNNYAAFIVLAFPFLLWSLAIARSRATKIFYLALCVTAPMLVIMTAGRLAMIAIACEMAVLLVLQRRRGSSIGWALSFGVAFAAVAIYMLRADTFAMTKLLLIGDELNAGGGASRLNLTLNGLLFTLKSFGIGAGAGSFESLMLAGRGTFPTGDIINPHNFWIEVMAQYGVVVFAFLVGSLVHASVAVLRLSRFSANRSSSSFWPMTALALGLTGYWLAAVENSRFIPQPFNWMFLGSVIALLAHLTDLRRDHAMSAYARENLDVT